MLFGALAAMPVIRAALGWNVPRYQVPTAGGVALLHPPSTLPPVPLAGSAKPVDAGASWAPPVSAALSSEAALVSAEDRRLRTLLHGTARVTVPTVVPLAGGPRTVLLPPRPAPYTATDLQRSGALVRLSGNRGLLVDSVLVLGGATLDIGSSDVGTLYLDSSAAGYTSIVTWLGTIHLHGSSSQPLLLLGWDRRSNGPAIDQGAGRPYIRDVGGEMDLTWVHTSDLGFWSGRTGGVAWTGASGHPARGGATSSRFIEDAFGAFVSRGDHVSFSSDLFEYNAFDGLRVHRYSVDATVSGSAAVRNGGNGFVVDRGANGTVLDADLSQHNQSNGFLLDGRPLGGGASATGIQLAPSSGTVVRAGDSEANGRNGILIEGGSSTVVEQTQVCAGQTGISVRDGASDTVLTGNFVRCGGRLGISLGPAITAPTVAGNTVEGSRIGTLIKDTPRVSFDQNVIDAATVFGVSIRGLASSVHGSDNSIAGSGFRAVDSRSPALPPKLTNTDVSGWHHHGKVTPTGYLRYHPLVAVWLGIALLALVGSLWSRSRRRPHHPYAQSTSWRPAPVISRDERVFALVSAAELPRPRVDGMPTPGELVGAGVSGGVPGAAAGARQPAPGAPAHPLAGPLALSAPFARYPDGAPTMIDLVAAESAGTGALGANPTAGSTAGPTANRMAGPAGSQERPSATGWPIHGPKPGAPG